MAPKTSTICGVPEMHKRHRAFTETACKGEHPGGNPGKKKDKAHK